MQGAFDPPAFVVDGGDDVGAGALQVAEAMLRGIVAEQPQGCADVPLAHDHRHPDGEIDHHGGDEERDEPVGDGDATAGQQDDRPAPVAGRGDQDEQDDEADERTVGQADEEISGRLAIRKIPDRLGVEPSHETNTVAFGRATRSVGGTASRCRHTRHRGDDPEQKPDDGADRGPE